MSQAVVDRLETIKVNKDDGKLLFRRRVAADQFGHPPLQLRTIGQTGQGVVFCQEPDLLLRQLSLNRNCCYSRGFSHQAGLNFAGYGNLVEIKGKRAKHLSLQ